MASHGGIHKKLRSARGASEISEFIPALYILFLITFLPLFNLGFLFVSAATLYLATNDFVSKASTQPDYPTSLNTMASEAYRFQSMGLAQFLSMFPQGGYTGCGDDLFVVATNIASGTITTSPADTAPTQPIDTSVNQYELSVHSSYSIAPMINLSAVPLLGAVPGLGQPVTLTFSANRPVEHPGGLIASNANTGSGNPVSPFNRNINPNATTQVAASTNVTWRNPNIFQQIQAAGQHVVSDSVFIVPANQPNWTNSGVSLVGGQNLWVDTQAIGMWSNITLTYASTFYNQPIYDANGVQSGYPNPPPPIPTKNYVSLVGVVGAGAPVSNTPNAFEVGNTLTNYPPAGTGPLFMMCNMSPGQFSFITSLGGGLMSAGAQKVRVIVTQ